MVLSVCVCVWREGDGKGHLLFEFFEFVVFLLAVFFYLFLRFGPGFFDTF